MTVWLVFGPTLPPGFLIVQYDLSYAFWSEDHLHALPLAALSQMWLLQTQTSMKLRVTAVLVSLEGFFGAWGLRITGLFDLD